MANENLKKFLDSAGVKHLWDKVATKIEEDIKLESDRAKGAEKALSDKIGDLGDSTTVVDYIAKATEGFESSETIENIQKDILDIKNDYATKASLDSYETVVNANAHKQEFTKYKEDNDILVAQVKATADAAASAEYVNQKLAEKANQSEFDSAKNILDALKSKVDTFFADDESVADTLDTLKELVDYLQRNPGEATDIATGLAALESKVNMQLDVGENNTVTGYVTAAINALDIGSYAKAQELLNLANKVNTGDQTVSQYVAAAISALDIGSYAKAQDLVNLANKVNTGDQTVSQYVASAISALNIGDYAKADELIALGRRVTALEGVTHVTEEYVDGRLGDIVNDNNEKITVSAYVDGKFAKITALTTDEIDEAIKDTTETE